MLWLAGLVAEGLLVGPTLAAGSWRGGAVAVALTSEVLRLATIWSLDRRWSMHVIVEDGVPRVTWGLFRFLRHPGYLAVTVQVIALPLALGLTVTPCAVAPLQAVTTGRRIAIEEAALRESAESS
ncbi:MAG: isoprenylcysteine carboxylmethyltransferase family protein [Planctomycetota bacterium]